MSARRDRNHSSRPICEQQVLERWPRQLLYTAPVFDPNEHRSLHPSSGDDLGTFIEACLQELAKTGFRVLDRPAL